MIEDRYSDIYQLLVRRGAETRSHSSATLLQHLVGTHRLLTRWEASSEVALAGLLHSVYGREEGQGIFVTADRFQIRSLVGERAENIAFHYSRSFRRLVSILEQDGEPAFRSECDALDVDLGSLNALVLIDVANLFEQMTRVAFPTDWIRRDLLRFIRLRDHLPEFLVKDLLSIFREKSDI